MATHPVDEFWDVLQTFHGYPPDVTPVPQLLPGTAAFAASAGLYRPAGSHDLPPFPYGGLMVIGHNLDSREGYDTRRRSGRSHGDTHPGPAMSTWRGLYKLLGLAGVSQTDFFFTNILVGLKDGPPTGRFSAHPAPAYRQWCRDFLGHQVATMRPRVVLALGRPATRDLAAATDPTPWPQGALPSPGPVSGRLHGHDTILVPAHHPSFQKRLAADAAALRSAW